MSTTIVEVPQDCRVDRVSPERCARGNLYVCEDLNRYQVMLIAQKAKNIQLAREELFPCESPAASSLFEASAKQLKRGRTGAWAVHRVAPDELPRFLAERRKRFGRTVIAASSVDAWRLTPTAQLAVS